MRIGYQVADRVCISEVLGFPNVIPDYSTVWRFRESLSDGDRTDLIWNELKEADDRRRGIKVS